MRRGYRYIILAAFGWLTLAASPPRNGTQGEQAKPQSTIAETLRELNSTLQNANKPDEGAKPCAKGEDNRNSDLCAQWKAADAAADGVDWTRRSFWLGVAGLCVGLLTLGAAGAAAYFAYRAAEETRRGADAAERSLQHARTATDLQVRPYIKTHHASLRHLVGDVWQVKSKITNSGSIPAAEAQGRITVILVDVANARQSVIHYGLPIIFNGIPANSSRQSSMFVGIIIAPSDVVAIKLAQKVLLCRASLCYKPLPHLPEETVELEMSLTGPDWDRKRFRSLHDWALIDGYFADWGN
jgi:hypothetical protein